MVRREQDLQNAQQDSSFSFVPREVIIGSSGKSGMHEKIGNISCKIVLSYEKKSVKNKPQEKTEERC